MSSELKQLRESNAILFSQWQQMLDENNEYKQLITEILEALERFKQRMKPVRQRAKARPKI